jgi:hypothetical protein
MVSVDNRRQRAYASLRVVDDGIDGRISNDRKVPAEMLITLQAMSNLIMRTASQGER